MKRIISLICALSLLGVTGYASNLTEHGDGFCALSETRDIPLVGKKVTLLVVEEDFPWFEEEAWENGCHEKVVYYGEETVQADNSYKFHFVLNKSGRYTAFATVDGEETVQEELIYVDSAKAGTAAELIRTGSRDNIIAALAVPEDLGIFNTVNAESVADILVQNVIFTDTKEQVLTKAKKAALMSLLHAGQVDNLEEYLYLLEGTPIFKYLTENLYSAVLNYLIGTTYADITAFDKAVQDSVLLAIVNGKDSEKMQQVLTEYKAYLGITQSNISTALCDAVVLKNSFPTLADAVKYINAYITENVSGGGSSAGGGGGGRGGSLNVYKDAKIVTDPEKYENPEDIKIFTDIDDVPWAEKAIVGLYYAGMINGKSETEFCPNDFITREEFAKIITLVFGMNLVDDDFPFTDVTPDDWCYSYVKTAYLAGITKGTSATTFGKGQNITRQDLCVMVHNALKASDDELPLIYGTMSFADRDVIEEYAKEAVSYMQRAGIVNGREEGRFVPDGFATRAEAAKIIYQVMINK